jgi:hypothetical protein
VGRKIIFTLESVTTLFVEGETAAGPVVFRERTTTVKRPSNAHTLRMGRLRFITINRHRGLTLLYTGRHAIASLRRALATKAGHFLPEKRRKPGEILSHYFLKKPVARPDTFTYIPRPVSLEQGDGA